MLFGAEILGWLVRRSTFESRGTGKQGLLFVVGSLVCDLGVSLSRLNIWLSQHDGGMKERSSGVGRSTVNEVLIMSLALVVTTGPE